MNLTEDTLGAELFGSLLGKEVNWQNYGCIHRE